MMAFSQNTCSTPLISHCRTDHLLSSMQRVSWPPPSLGVRLMLLAAMARASPDHASHGGPCTHHLLMGVAHCSNPVVEELITTIGWTYTLTCSCDSGLPSCGISTNIMWSEPRFRIWHCRVSPISYNDNLSVLPFIIPAVRVISSNTLAGCLFSSLTS